MNTRILAAAAFAAAFIAPAAQSSAATLDDVVARLDAIQRENAAMRQENSVMRREIAALRREKTRPEATAFNTTPPASSAPSRDLPARVSSAMAAAPAAGYVSYKAAPVAGPYDWSGFYAGLNAGYAFGRDTTFFPGIPLTLSSDYDGFFGGGQIGYSWQYGALVLGVEADIQAAAIGGRMSSASIGNVDLTINNKMDAFGTVRGRVGYAFDRVLVYGTGGFAAGRNTSSFSFAGLSGGNPVQISGSDSAIHTGWAAGAGLEYGLRDGWSLKGEYLHIELDPVTLQTGPSSPQFKYDIVRSGVNYHF